MGDGRVGCIWHIDGRNRGSATRTTMGIWIRHIVCLALGTAAIAGVGGYVGVYTFAGLGVIAWILFRAWAAMK